MFLQVIFVVFLSSFALSQNPDELPPELRDVFIDHINVCKAQEGATDEDIVRHMKYHEATTQTGKCFLLCLQESFGLSQNGEIHPEAAVQLGRIVLGNDEKILELVRKDQEGCSPIYDADKCEQAHKRYDCAKLSAKKHGISSGLIQIIVENASDCIPNIQI